MKKIGEVIGSLKDMGMEKEAEKVKQKFIEEQRRSVERN